MEITACPNCGSRRIFQGRLKDGVLTGYTSRDVCRDCGYRGSPLIFDNDEYYQNFLKGLKAEKEGKTIDLEEKDVELNEKEKETIEFLKELKEEKDKERKNKPRILKNSIVWLSIVSIVASFWITSRGGLLMIFGFALLIVGIILFFVGIFSQASDKSSSMTSRTTFAGVFLMMSGVLSFISWSNVFYTYEEFLGDALLVIQQFETYGNIETVTSFLFLFSLIGIIFSILAIIGGIYAIKKKFYFLTFVFSIFGVFTFGPLFFSTILSFISLVLIVVSKKEFGKNRQS